MKTPAFSFFISILFISCLFFDVMASERHSVLAPVSNYSKNSHTQENTHDVSVEAMSTEDLLRVKFDDFAAASSEYQLQVLRELIAKAHAHVAKREFPQAVRIYRGVLKNLPAGEHPEIVLAVLQALKTIEISDPGPRLRFKTLRILSRHLTFKNLRDTGKCEEAVLAADQALAQLRAEVSLLRPLARIGDPLTVLKLDGNFLTVEDPETKEVFVIEFTRKQDSNEVTGNLIKQIESGYAAPSCQEAVGGILKVFDQIPFDRKPSISVYPLLKSKRFGLASANPAIIAVHEYFDQDPIVLLHEIAEYLVKADLLTLTFDFPCLVVRDKSGTELGRVPMDESAIHEFMLETGSPHSRLRALQQMAFGEKDKELTTKIRLARRLRIRTKKYVQLMTDLLHNALFKNPSFMKGISSMIDREINLDDLNGDMRIAPYGEQSANKLVFSVTMLTQVKDQIDVIFALKKEKEIGNVKSIETEGLQWIDNSPCRTLHAVPHFVMEFFGPDGKRVYVEELIAGFTEGECSRRNVLTPALREKVITNSMVVGVALGNNFITDTNPGNTIVTPQQEVVLVDIGDERMSVEEVLKKKDPVPALEYLVLQIFHHCPAGNEKTDGMIVNAFFQALDQVEGAFKGDTYPLKGGKTVSQAREEILQLMEFLCDYVRDELPRESLRVAKAISENASIRAYAESKDMDEFQRARFTANLLRRVQQLFALPQISKVGKGPGSSTGQIGSEPAPRVLEGGRAAEIIDVSGRAHPLTLEPRGSWDLARWQSQIKAMPNISPDHRRLMDDMLSHLRKVPQSFELKTLMGDRFAFASGEHDMIALHASVFDEPVAQFHEIMEYMVRSGELAIEFKTAVPRLLKKLGLYNRYQWAAWLKGDVVIKDRTGAILGTLSLSQDALAVALKGEGDPHYLLRGMARQIFQQEDVKITRRIKQVLAENLAQPDIDVTTQTHDFLDLAA